MTAAAAAAARAAWAMSVPSSRIRPAVGVSSRTMARAMVDLPQPDSPTMASVAAGRDGEADVVDRAEHAARRPGIDDEVLDAPRQVVSVIAPASLCAVGVRGPRPRAQGGDGREQLAGVLVCGVLHDLLDGPDSTKRPSLHDMDAVGHQPGDAEVVGDHQDADAGAFLQVQQQVEDARLDGDVQGARWVRRRRAGRVRRRARWR